MPGGIIKQRKRHGIRHGRESRGRWMQMVAGVECRKQMIGALRIASDFVEIHERVEVIRAANPGIDGLTVRFGRRRWMVKSGIRERENRRSDDLNAMRVRA